MIKGRPISYFGVFVSLALLFGACERKEELGPIPSIEIREPAGANTTIQIPDTFLVKARIKSEEKVGFVRMDLIDQNGIPITNTESFKPGKKEFTVTGTLELNDVRVPSGVYKIQVLAKTNEKENKGFKDLTLLEAPVRFKGYFAVTNPGGQATEVYRYDENFQGGAVLSRHDDFSGAALSSYFQLLFLAGKETADFRALEAETMDEQWVVPNRTNPPFPYFTGIQNSPEENLAFVSLSTGDIRAYNGDGSIRLTADALEDHHPRIARPTGKFIVTYQEQVNNQDRELVVYFRSTGELKERFPVEGKVVDIYSRSKDKAYVIMNEKGQGHLRIFDISSGGMWEPTQSPNGIYRDAHRMNNGVILLGHSSGIYRFLPSSNALVEVTSVPSPDHLTFSEVHSQVLIGDGKAVQKFDLSSGNLMNTVVLPDTVREVMVWNNK